MLIARLVGLLIALVLIVAPQGGDVMPTGMAMGAASAAAAAMDCEDADAALVDCCVVQCCPALPVWAGGTRAAAASRGSRPCDARIATLSEKAPERPPP